MIDAVQDAAIALSELAFGLQALAFKHAQEVSIALAMMRPALRGMPLIGRLADSSAVTGPENLSHAIVEFTQKAQSTILDVKQSLLESNPMHLKKYLEDLNGYKMALEALLVR